MTASRSTTHDDLPASPAAADDAPLADGPLTGITVIDLTRVLSGPYCTMLLGDMGARVIKIEQPGKGDDTRGWGPPFISGESAYFMSVNRNKESVTIDFKQPGGRRILEDLIARADVLVENFKPGTLDRAGLGWRDLKDRLPRLIYCSISGFGHTGPKRELPGYDAVVQAEAGLMSITGSEEGPSYRLGVAVADIVSGMFAAQSVLLAILARARTGRGQHADVAMLDSTAALLTYQAAIYFATGEAPKRMGNRHPTIVPYETFEAADGEFVLAVGNDDQWKRFCAAAGLDNLGADGRFDTNRKRVGAYATFRPLLASVLRQRPRSEWIAILSDVGVPCGAVRSLDAVLTDPHLIERAMIAALQHPAAGAIQVMGVPIKLSDTPGAVRTPPPMLGQHTRAVLTQDLGLDEASVDALADQRVI